MGQIFQSPKIARMLGTKSSFGISGLKPNVSNSRSPDSAHVALESDQNSSGSRYNDRSVDQMPLEHEEHKEGMTKLAADLATDVESSHKVCNSA